MNLPGWRTDLRSSKERSTGARLFKMGAYAQSELEIRSVGNQILVSCCTKLVSSWL
jgi:hypothetical protein